MISFSPSNPEPQSAFDAWLDDFDAVQDEQRMLRQLWNCRDRVPAECCEILDLPVGSTYHEAVMAVLSSWETTTPHNH